MFSWLRFRRKEKMINPVHQAGLWHRITEPFTGAWQRNIEEKRGDTMTYPTLYACIFRISSDMSKLPFQVRKLSGDIWKLVHGLPIHDLLLKPNHYQNSNQFREQWLLSKLTHGNAYILKLRGERGDVKGLYILDPSKVLPAISDAGEVYYMLKNDKLNKLPEDYPLDKLTIPASEIIHDRFMALHHPLVGVPPLSAANWAAVKNLKIMRNATDFFANSSQPGGLLTAPAGMSQNDADAVKAYWETEFSGTQSGKVAIIGADMKFTPFAMKSIDSQMIEQMKYSDEQICQPFGIPPFKVGIGTLPSGLGVDGLNQLYYSDALQAHIEAMEELLNEHLPLDAGLTISLDLEPLLRMDEGKKAEVESKLVGAKIKTPDEGRARFNLDSTDGGDTLWGQTQDVPLGVLAQVDRWESGKPMTPPVVVDDPEVDPEPEDNTEKFIAAIEVYEAIYA